MKNNAGTVLGVVAFAAFTGSTSVAGCKTRTPPAEPAAEAAEKKAPTTVTMSPAAILAAGVVTAPVVQGTITVRDEMPGTIEAPRDALVVVNTRAPGVVEALQVDVGDRVTAGQRLATVRSLELAKAQADYRRGVVAGQHAASTLKRTEELHSEGLLSQRRVEADRLASRESQLEVEESTEHIRILGGSLKDTTGTIAITSPIAGTIATRAANRGEAVAENAPLFTVVDVSKVVAQVRAPGGVHVEPGTETSFTVESLPGRSFAAIVKSASDVVDPETRRFFLRCSVANTDGVLKPGMFITAKVPRPGVRALTVPETAVQTMEGGTVVFVALDGGRFDRRSVVLGPRAEGQVAVESGLVAGEAIVVQGAFWVRTELQKSELEE